MTELEAYILRLENDLASSIDMIDQIENNKLPEADELGVKEQMLKHESKTRDDLKNHIKNMKLKLNPEDKA
jgi:hypothetical protein